MSNSDVSSNNLFRRIRWRIAFPAIAVLLNLWLQHLDWFWSIGAAKWDDLAATSAQGLIILLNGPVFWLLFPYLPNGLDWILIITFWAWIGWLIDRPLAGNRSIVIRPRWLRGSLYALGFALGVFFLWHAGSEILFNRFYSYVMVRAFWESPHAHLMGREIETLAAAVWGLICVLCFGGKLLDLARKRPSAVAR